RTAVLPRRSNKTRSLLMRLRPHTCGSEPAALQRPRKPQPPTWPTASPTAPALHRTPHAAGPSGCQDLRLAHTGEPNALGSAIAVKLDSAPRYSSPTANNAIAESPSPGATA